jgi:hypothetical protein
MHVRPGIERVGKKDEIEFGTLRGPGDPLNESETFRTRLGVFQSPRGDVMTRAKDEQAKMHVATFCHAQSLNPKLNNWTDGKRLWDSVVWISSENFARGEPCCPAIP